MKEGWGSVAGNLDGQLTQVHRQSSRQTGATLSVNRETIKLTQAVCFAARLQCLGMSEIRGNFFSKYAKHRNAKYAAKICG